MALSVRGEMLREDCASEKECVTESGRSVTESGDRIDKLLFGAARANAKWEEAWRERRTRDDEFE